MEKLPGTGNSQIELDFDNKYDNVEHPDPNDDWEFHVEDMDDFELDKDSMWFTIYSPKCEVFGRLILTRKKSITLGFESLIERRVWD
jgi:hypothetical protein